MHKTMEPDGFFEGVYDWMPDLQREGAVSDQVLRRRLPHLQHWEPSMAQPVIFGLPRGVARVLKPLTPPYWQTSQTRQIGMQYFYGDRQNEGVPDGYAVQFSRYGICKTPWRHGDADVHHDLTVYVLRTSVASQLRQFVGKQNNPGYDELRWAQVARVGTCYANATIAYAQDRYRSRGLLTRTGGKTGIMKSAARPLAEDIFWTMVYWPN